MAIAAMLLMPAGAALAQEPTLEEALTSSRCAGTPWAERIDRLRSAQPEAEADAQIAEGNASLRAGLYGQARGIVVSLSIIGSTVRDHVSDEALHFSPTQSLSGGIGYPGAACALGQAAVPVAPIDLRALEGPPEQAWCARVLLRLINQHAERFNRRMVTHELYPDKDLCGERSTAPGQRWVRPIDRTAQPGPELIPKQASTVAEAARFGLVEQVSQFVEQRVDLRRQDRFSMDALGWSVTRNYASAFDVLMKAEGDQDFCSALARAFQHDRDALLIPLIARCAVPRQLDSHVLTAANRGRMDIVRQLMEHGALGRNSHPAGYETFQAAIKHNDYELASRLFDRGIVQRLSALRLALTRRQTALADILLNRYADPALLDWIRQGQALHLAIESRTPAIVRLLVARGADPSRSPPPMAPATPYLTARALPPPSPPPATPTVDPLGRPFTPAPRLDELMTRRYREPPLLLAIDPLRDSNMIRLLLELGASPNVRDSLGETPLIIAITRSRIYGRRGGAPWIEPDVPARLIPGQEHWEHQGTEAVLALLAAKADVAATDRHKMTALHHAARSDYAADIVRLLLDAGADAAARDAAGRTPLEHARELGLERVPEILMKARR